MSPLSQFQSRKRAYGGVLLAVVGFGFALLGAGFLPDTGVALLDSMVPPILAGFGVGGVGSAIYLSETRELSLRACAPGVVTMWIGFGLVLAASASALPRSTRLLLGGIGFAAAVVGNGRLARLRRARGVEPTDERLREIEWRATQRSWQLLVGSLFAATVGLYVVDGSEDVSPALLVLVGLPWLAITSRRVFEGYYESTI